MDEIKKVLLVEDDEVDAMEVGRMLRAPVSCCPYRFDLTAVRTLADGLSRVRKEPWDLIIVDLSLPDSPYDQTFGRLYCDSLCTPVIILTGREDEALAQDCVACGAFRYFVKGKTDAATLQGALSEALGSVKELS
jgi:CheY-like chemotaxis protein